MSSSGRSRDRRSWERTTLRPSICVLKASFSMAEARETPGAFELGVGRSPPASVKKSRSPSSKEPVPRKTSVHEKPRENFRKTPSCPLPEVPLGTTAVGRSKRDGSGGSNTWGGDHNFQKGAVRAKLFYGPPSLVFESRSNYTHARASAPTRHNVLTVLVLRKDS